MVTGFTVGVGGFLVAFGLLARALPGPRDVAARTAGALLVGYCAILAAGAL